jgi:hypothetical protein
VQNQQLAQQYLFMANQLQGGGLTGQQVSNSGTSAQNATTTSAQNTTMTGAAAQTIVSPPPQQGGVYHLPKRFSSVTRIYDEWYGGETASLQVREQGIDGMDDATKKACLKYPGDEQRISRMRKVIEVVNQALKRVGATKNSVLAEFDRKMAGKSLTPFVKELIDEKLVTIVPRAKKGTPRTDAAPNQVTQTQV